MNIYYIKSEWSEGRITAYCETCWLNKLANARLHLRLCKDIDLVVDRSGFLKFVWSDAREPQKSFRKASDKHTRWQSETSNLLRNLLPLSINVSNSCTGLFESDHFRLHLPIRRAHETCKDRRITGRDLTVKLTIWMKKAVHCSSLNCCLNERSISLRLKFGNGIFISLQIGQLSTVDARLKRVYFWVWN
jgi:hypothetical protein